MSSRQRRAPRPVRTVLFASSIVALVGAAVWKWSTSRTTEGTPKAPAPRRTRGKNPTLSLSFPLDSLAARQAEVAGSLTQQQMDALLAQIQTLYQVHALVYAPDNHKPLLPGVDPLRVLPYSLSEGRAMLARALQCQCHVELVVVNEDGFASLWNENAEQDAELPAYLTRLEQLARGVDSLFLAFVPGESRAGVRADDVRAAFGIHAVSQRANVHLLAAPPGDGWEALAHALVLQRDAWN